jgi:hypothetical protein
MLGARKAIFQDEMQQRDIGSFQLCDKYGDLLGADAQHPA